MVDAGLEPSVGSVGDSYDNALAETIIGLFKTEVINRSGPWKSKDQVEWETLKWVDWFNKERLLEPLGYITPVEAEEKYELNSLRQNRDGSIRFIFTTGEGRKKKVFVAVPSCCRTASLRPDHNQFSGVFRGLGSHRKTQPKAELIPM